MTATALAEVMRPLEAEGAEGAESLVTEAAGVVRVRDRSGALVFEFDANSGRSVLYVAAGDLEIRVPEGAVKMSARDGVSIDSEGSVDIAAQHAVKLVSRGLEGAPGSSVVLDPRGTAVATPRLDARAHTAEVSVGEARVLARSLHTAVETARQVAGVVEVQASRIVERAKNVYREVEELSQTRAGRIRVVALTTYHLLGKRTLLKAEEDMKIRGEKIHLG
ncbi:MAG: DUF3540 domain-containing protein [Myxococcales bacterium]|nr:DUF3540 domain-containing protein [Myxococcales bacterium]